LRIALLLLSLLQGFNLGTDERVLRGAKTALTLALEYPNLIKDVVAVDNCPIRLPLESDFAGYLQGLARLRDERIKNHWQADRIMSQYEKVLLKCHPPTHHILSAPAI
jgi:hypothetical protein